MRIILASQSPRRKELLELMGLKFEVIVSNQEEVFEKNLTIEEQSKIIALGKAKSVFEKTDRDRIVIGSDTIVVKKNKIYGKPKNENDAKDMLLEFKNSKVQVITSIAILIQNGDIYEEYVDYDIADIYIKDMTNEEIDKWIQTGEAMDKAGAFAIQSKFSVFIEKIVGNYNTIVGLPIHKLYDVIKSYIK